MLFDSVGVKSSNDVTAGESRILYGRHRWDNADTVGGDWL